MLVGSSLVSACDLNERDDACSVAADNEGTLMRSQQVPKTQIYSQDEIIASSPSFFKGRGRAKYEGMS